jgi:hypothetical protein
MAGLHDRKFTYNIYRMVGLHDGRFNITFTWW